jgi:hypothetical protein
MKDGENNGTFKDAGRERKQDDLAYSKRQGEKNGGYGQAKEETEEEQVSNESERQIITKQTEKEKKKREKRKRTRFKTHVTSHSARQRVSSELIIILQMWSCVQKKKNRLPELETWIGKEGRRERTRTPDGSSGCYRIEWKDGHID